MKQCTQCKSPFSLENEDLTLLDKLDPVINGQKYALPEPDICFDCRQQKLMVWRNERSLFRRKCDFSGDEIVSMYPPDSPFKIYKQKVWWSDEWDAREYGRDFDFSRPFFEQFRELQLRVPRVALVNKQSENSEFTNHSANNKNCYLSYVVFDSEDIYYTDFVIDHCIDCIDCSYLIEACELCYETYYAWGCYMAFFCDFVKRCKNTWFCFDCINCEDCFMCWNLRNKKYCIRNWQYSKSEYTAEMKKIFPIPYSELQKLRREYAMSKAKLAIHPAIFAVQAVGSSGNLLFNTKDCIGCFEISGSEDCRYCTDTAPAKDSMDCYHIGWSELIYECHAIANGFNCLFSHFCYDSKNAIYCDCAHNCNNVFGCVSLHHKQYCILNKQYSKEEYEKLVPEIILHMKKTGEWGRFFPMAFSPFGYNQSKAKEYYPISREYALSKGIPWSDYKISVIDASKTIPANELPDIEDARDDILNWAIKCEASGRLFKIVKHELDFYRKNRLPLPRRHPDQRYEDRITSKTPRKLYDRKCANCQSAIQTPYSPERPETVYCEQCYLKTVY